MAAKLFTVGDLDYNQKNGVYFIEEDFVELDDLLIHERLAEIKVFVNGKLEAHYTNSANPEIDLLADEEITVGLHEGLSTLHIEARSSATGEIQKSEAYLLEVDTVAAQIQFESPSHGANIQGAETFLSFNISENNLAKTMYRVDGADFKEISPNLELSKENVHVFQADIKLDPTQTVHIVEVMADDISELRSCHYIVFGNVITEEGSAWSLAVEDLKKIPKPKCPLEYQQQQDSNLYIKR